MTGHEVDRIADIQAGIEEAGRGEFATNAEVAATIRKYVKRLRPSCRPERSEGPDDDHQRSAG
jgi:hypothetical protein